MTKMFMAAGVDDRPSGLSGVRGYDCGQPGLADPRRTCDGHERPSDAVVQCAATTSNLALAADEAGDRCGVDIGRIQSGRAVNNPYGVAVLRRRRIDRRVV